MAYELIIEPQSDGSSILNNIIKQPSDYLNKLSSKPGLWLLIVETVFPKGFDQYEKR